MDAAMFDFLSFDVLLGRACVHVCVCVYICVCVRACVRVCALLIGIVSARECDLMSVCASVIMYACVSLCFVIV